jgi:peroxiredoxin (alkyl hydroperoxide reductase subunit C)
MENKMSVLVGRPAPDFTAAAVLGSGEIVDSFSLSEAIKGKKAVVFLPTRFYFCLSIRVISF